MVHLKIRDCARASDLVLDIWIQTCWVQGSLLGIELRKRPFDEPSRSQSKLANMFSTGMLENKSYKNNMEQHLWYSNLYVCVYIYICTCEQVSNPQPSVSHSKLVDPYPREQGFDSPPCGPMDRSMSRLRRRFASEGIWNKQPRSGYGTDACAQPVLCPNMLTKLFSNLHKAVLTIQKQPETPRRLNYNWGNGK